MVKTFKCKNCGRLKPANPRLKGTQHYCNDIDCQRARKAAWIKLKRATDSDYHDAQQDYASEWCENKSASAYMRQYRQEHPDYVKTNKIKQRFRNQRRRAKERQKEIVKVDALTNHKYGTYIMTILPAKIVKVDAFLVELQAYHGDSEALSINNP
ncbi:MAG: hypothetical protein JSW07_11190 [bacterium]|nr:MAG: hypothetical protein JSW07_11190 [bacterium]